MDWITKRYDQFYLAVSASALVVCAGLICLRMQSFETHFGSALAFVPKDDAVPIVSLDRIDGAKDKLANPPAWQPIKENAFGHPERGSLFVSELYWLKDPWSAPEKPHWGSAVYKDSLTDRAIPNSWFMQYGLPLLDSTVPLQDADKDGFTNEDEWRAQTNPTDPASHPPYYTKLFLDQFIQVPFPYIFSGGSDSKGQAIQLDSIDHQRPTVFIKLGEMVPETKFKFEKFAFKEALNPATQDVKDVSELTLVNVDTGKKVVLVLNGIAHSPEAYARFVYEWPAPAQTIQVKEGEDFVLRPEADESHRYQLIDVNETQARIRLPSGEIEVIQPDPRRAPGALP
ncbi:MAG TPA: Amuc_1099 family pilus-like system protein [Chthoniobacter sp.]|jgi:hypothetical protein